MAPPAFWSAMRAQTPRVRLVRNVANLGLVGSLNRGFEMARGRYIARMDADDVSDSKRFAEQVAHLDASPGCVVVGTGWRNVDDDGRVLGDTLPPVSNTEIQAYLLRGSPVCHSVAMIRADVLRAAGLEYRKDVPHAEDYDLWVRLLTHGKGYNIPKNLLRVRRLRQGVSISRRKEQLESHCRITFEAIRSRLPEYEISTTMASAIVGQFGNIPELLTEAGQSSSSVLERFDELLRLFLRRYGVASESSHCLGRTYLTMAMSEYNMGHYAGARRWLYRSMRAWPALFLRPLRVVGWENLTRGLRIFAGSHDAAPWSAEARVEGSTLKSLLILQ